MSMTAAEWQQSISDTIRQATSVKNRLRIFAGCSKYGAGDPRASDITGIDLSGCTGITDYDPSELYISLLAGTPLTQVNKLLAQNNQELSFEPPTPKRASIGGAVATGVTGSSMPYRGALRNSVLAVRMVNGRGEALNFGAPVIKNVAGFDLAKLMAGSFGMLGPVIELTLRVMTTPESRVTLVFERELEQSIESMVWINRQFLPVEAQAWYQGRHYIRLAGAATLVDSTARKLGGAKVRSPAGFWNRLVSQAHPEFGGEGIILRHSCIADQPLETFPEMTPFAIDWAGALRWYSLTSNDYLRHLNKGLINRIRDSRGHCWRYIKPSMFLNNIVPIEEKKHMLHNRIRAAFDPESLFNPDLKWYSES